MFIVLAVVLIGIGYVFDKREQRRGTASLRSARSGPRERGAARGDERRLGTGRPHEPAGDGERTGGGLGVAPARHPRSAQFVMVLDSSVMNVSISQIVADLDTTVAGVQLAITAYTLVMAAFMLVGARLGDIWGRDKAFAIGLGIYGARSLTTALSPNLTVLLIGWSLVEGARRGPRDPGDRRADGRELRGQDARARLRDHRRRRRGSDRARPADRRLGHHDLHLALRLRGRDRRRRFHPALPEPDESSSAGGGAPRLDFVGAALPARASTRRVRDPEEQRVGLAEPIGTPTIAGHEVTPFGFSPVPFLILAGVLLLWAFSAWERRRERRGRTRCSTGPCSRSSTCAPASTLLMQQPILLGTFFVLLVYLQVVLGLDAFETGKRLLPMSVTMLLALAGPRLAERFAPRGVARLGLVALVIGAFGLLGTVDVELDDWDFAVALASSARVSACSSHSSAT